MRGATFSHKQWRGRNAMLFTRMVFHIWWSGIRSIIGGNSEINQIKISSIHEKTETTITVGNRVLVVKNRPK